MSMRPPLPEEVFSAKMRLCLFHNTEYSAEEALALDEKQITAELLVAKGVKASNMTTAGVGPKLLKVVGVADCSSLRKLGFDSLYLADTKFASEANAAFGSKDVIRAFLTGASDAVAIAGTDAVDILGIHAQDLLTACAGAPTEAQAVLQQLPVGVSLSGVQANVLLDTGIRRQALAEVGYSLTSVASQTSATAQQLAKLGYTLG
jgi:hypothetical protein